MKKVFSFVLICLCLAVLVTPARAQTPTSTPEPTVTPTPSPVAVDLQTIGFVTALPTEIAGASFSVGLFFLFLMLSANKTRSTDIMAFIAIEIFCAPIWLVNLAFWAAMIAFWTMMYVLITRLFMIAQMPK